MKQGFELKISGIKEVEVEVGAETEEEISGVTGEKTIYILLISVLLVTCIVLFFKVCNLKKRSRNYQGNLAQTDSKIEQLD